MTSVQRKVIWETSAGTIDRFRAVFVLDYSALVREKLFIEEVTGKDSMGDPIWSLVNQDQQYRDGSGLVPSSLVLEMLKKLVPGVTSFTKVETNDTN